jgi:OOP family OmpA-OmpF porin
MNMETRRGLALKGAALLGMVVSRRSAAQEHVRSFLIYFRWNSAVLKPAMQKRVLEAARSATHHRSSRIEVTGYTDTSMADAESNEISTRMAYAVADELTKHGITRDIIVVRGMGEENPSEMTADGVVNSKNRRVEIAIQ